MPNLPTLQLLPSPEWKDYELLDSGNGQKLERYGAYIFSRPEPEAIWSPMLSEKEWDNVHAVFKPSPEENGGHWVSKRSFPERWQMEYKGIKFWVQTTNSRHLGVFPEQASQWDWIQAQTRAAGRPIKVLNLFGYTGVASLAAAKAGASVTHVDASKKVVTWAHENLTLSGMDSASVRWIVDDALKFVQREVRRGATYDGIILDPPKFGRGPKGEIWEFYKLLPDLIQTCQQLLSPNAIFLLITAYAVKASSVTLHYGLQDILKDRKGVVSAGEVLLSETSGGRQISMAIFGRWSSLK